jgi:hypothetical protein
MVQEIIIFFAVFKLGIDFQILKSVFWPIQVAQSLFTATPHIKDVHSEVISDTVFHLKV